MVHEIRRYLHTRKQDKTHRKPRVCGQLMYVAWKSRQNVSWSLDWVLLARATTKASWSLIKAFLEVRTLGIGRIKIHRSKAQFEIGKAWTNIFPPSTQYCKYKACVCQKAPGWTPHSKPRPKPIPINHNAIVAMDMKHSVEKRLIPVLWEQKIRR